MVSRGKEDFEKIALLFEFYGGLLPEKQFKFMSLYYEDDLSLSEISDEMGVTRQAVHDGIKHAKEALLNYEEKLNMVEKVITVERNVKRINEIITTLESSDVDSKVKAELKDIKEKLKELED